MVLGLLLRGVDDVLHGLERAVGLHRPDIVVDDVVHDRREALEPLLAADLRIEIAGIHARHVEIAERVAVRLRGGERAPADPAAATGAVLDRHRLADHRLQILRQQARGDVGAAAGAIRHDQRQVPLRILRMRDVRAGEQERRRARGGAQEIRVWCCGSSCRPPSDLTEPSICSTMADALLLLLLAATIAASEAAWSSARQLARQDAPWR